MRFPRAYVLAGAITIAGCGSAGGPAPSAVPVPSVAPAPAPAPTPAPPPSTASVSITPFGLIPYEATVGVGGRVTFVNNDNVPHDIQGGPDPDHRDCPEIDVVSFLTPGQSRATNPLTTERTCEYHDHTQLSVAAFQGRIFIR